MASEFMKYYNCHSQLSSIEINIGATRKDGYNEAFTEGLYCYVTNSVRVIKVYGSSSSCDCYNFDTNQRIQIKSSQLEEDCSSFGPKSQFDELVYLHINPMTGEILLYDQLQQYLKNLQISATQSFEDQKKQGRRPRFSIKKKIIEKYSLTPRLRFNLKQLSDYYMVVRYLNKCL